MKRVVEKKGYGFGSLPVWIRKRKILKSVHLGLTIERCKCVFKGVKSTPFNTCFHCSLASGVTIKRPILGLGRSCFLMNESISH